MAQYSLWQLLICLCRSFVNIVNFMVGRFNSPLEGAIAQLYKLTKTVRPALYQVRGKLRQAITAVIPAKAGIYRFLPLCGTGMTIC